MLNGNIHVKLESDHNLNNTSIKRESNSDSMENDQDYDHVGAEDLSMSTDHVDSDMLDA